LTNPVFHSTSKALSKKVLIIDCDVHQGDGTAKFTSNAIISPERMVTLSIHCQDNYPFEKAMSTYDIGLPQNCTDDSYMVSLKHAILRALKETRPDFVLYDAGVDVYERDKLGRLCISLKGMRQRDRWVLETCVQHNIPVAAVIGGGYDKDINALARRHAIVHEECAYLWRKYKMWRRE